MKEPIIVLVGFTLAAVNSLQNMEEKYRVLIIEEPDVIRKRNIDTLIKNKDVIYDLVSFEYQKSYAPDQLFSSLQHLNVVSVAPAVEYATTCAARLAERFKLPGASFGASLILRDKSVLRRVTSAYGVLNPLSQSVTAFEEANDFMMNHPGGVVLKPSNRQGSVGTVIVHELQDLHQAWNQSQLRDEGVMVPDRVFNSETLIEEFVVGKEYSVEALIKDSKMVFSNVTQKILFSGVRPVEQGHIVPALIDKSLKEALINQTQKVIQAVGFENGVVHCEWINADKGLYLVECAGRFAGDGIVELIERAYDYDLVKNYHRLLRNQPIDLPPEVNKRWALVHFYAGRDGELSRANIGNELLKQLDCFNFSLSVTEGQKTNCPSSSWDRLGSVMVLADTEESIRFKSLEVTKTVEFVYKDI
ncbi:ATP-grasp domain-containing protein [Pantoea rodasii]|uniref:ATP-grasp domain-containing protein n=1 Tax=Pantoea rodasii TaxID=1076549 RepID=UPI00068DFE13|nr:ATP-grasp domain-containing protein [Pantoea rodasii]